jgi:hypothetical protein
MAEVTNGTKAEICQKRAIPVFNPSFNVSNIPKPIKNKQITNKAN